MLAWPNQMLVGEFDAFWNGSDMFAYVSSNMRRLSGVGWEDIVLFFEEGVGSEVKVRSTHLMS